MTGGLIQLAAVGAQNVILTNDPQITFFKMVYRRHTNFSYEPIKQYFDQKPDFKKKASCIISKNGDLIGKIVLVIELPQIKEIYNNFGVDNIIKFAWVRKIGYAIIKEIDIVIGGHIIDRHYGEWLNIWAELTQKTDDGGIDKMIGNIPELYSFTNVKDSYTLYIPLQFWFCRTIGLALPIVCLQYSEVIVNIELNEFEKCSIITPSHYIELVNDVIPFKPYDYIYQSLTNTDVRIGQYLYFDNINKRMYYTKISNKNFETNIPVESYIRLNNDYPYNIINLYEDQYKIYNDNTYKWVYPKIGTTTNPTQPYIYLYQPIKNVTIRNCYLLVDYYYLDEDERIRFANTRHDYLIEQLQYTGEKTFDSPNNNINISFLHPSKLLVWIVQQSYLLNPENNDLFNYTISHEYVDNQLVGDTIIIDNTINLNSHDRLSIRSWSYFNYVQPYQHFLYDVNEGINIYSFALFPDKIYPTGTCNMSQINSSFIKFSTEPIINSINKGKFRAYSLGYNVFRIINGLGGIIFDA